MLARLEQLRATRYVSPLEYALVYAALGRIDDALTSLERAYEDRVSDFARVKLLPWPDTVREHPRFIAPAEEARRRLVRPRRRHAVPGELRPERLRFLPHRALEDARADPAIVPCTSEATVHANRVAPASIDVSVAPASTRIAEPGRALDGHAEAGERIDVVELDVKGESQRDAADAEQCDDTILCRIDGFHRLDPRPRRRRRRRDRSGSTRRRRPARRSPGRRTSRASRRRGRAARWRWPARAAPPPARDGDDTRHRRGCRHSPARPVPPSLPRARPIARRPRCRPATTRRRGMARRRAR